MFYRVIDREGTGKGLLYKEFPLEKAHMRDRLCALVRHINDIEALGYPIRTVVRGLPLLAVERTTGFGVLMADIQTLEGKPAPPIDEITITTISLHTRLNMALDLAEQVEALHAAGILQSDLSSPNILAHWVGGVRSVSIIDLDTAAVIDVRGQEGYLYGLDTEIRINNQISFPAPEIELWPADKHSRKLSNLASERWSLAVAVHFLLVEPQDPFFFYEGMSVNYPTIVRGRYPWPPRGDGVDRGGMAQYISDLYRLDSPLYEAFLQVFHRPVGVAFDLDNRPGATEWVRLLTEAVEHVVRCQCGTEYVALASRPCPICASESHRVRIVDGRRVLRMAHPWPWGSGG